MTCVVCIDHHSKLSISPAQSRANAWIECSGPSIWSFVPETSVFATSYRTCGRPLVVIDGGLAVCHQAPVSEQSPARGRETRGGRRNAAGKCPERVEYHELGHFLCYFIVTRQRPTGGQDLGVSTNGTEGDKSPQAPRQTLPSFLFIRGHSCGSGWLPKMRGGIRKRC